MKDNSNVSHNEFMYKCLMWPLPNITYPWYIRYIAPFIQTWYYGVSYMLSDYVPIWIRRKIRRKTKSIKIPASFGRSDEDIFHACFAVLGNFVENELGIAPTEKENKFDQKVWGYKTETYRGYRLHSQDQPAIDLWIWYKHERQMAIDGERTLEQLSRGPIDGYEIQYFDKSYNEPDYVIAKRYEYEKKLKEYRFLHFGRHSPNKPNDSSKFDDIKFDELIKMRHSLWT